VLVSCLPSTILKSRIVTDYQSSN